MKRKPIQRTDEVYKLARNEYVRVKREDILKGYS